MLQNATDLNGLMEFDHVIRVHPDGTVTEPADIWAPELVDGDVSGYAQVEGQPTGWQLLNGYSGQWQYSGPIMHPSEFIGGRMERDILAEPGLYVALVNHVSTPVDDCVNCPPADTHGPCDVHDINGWAVACVPDVEV